jgi:small subunit ribosomal protein S18
MAASREDVKFLSNPKLGLRRKKYCRFRRFGIKHIDYKDADFLLQFVNEQGKLLPRRITGNSLKFQRRISTAVKRARHLAMMPFLADLMK